MAVFYLYSCNESESSIIYKPNQRSCHSKIDLGTENHLPAGSRVYAVHEEVFLLESELFIIFTCNSI